MSWEVSNLIINDDSGVTITGSRGSLSNVNPSTIFNVYLSDAQSRTRMNPNANTILCGRGNSSAGYSIVFGYTLPTDKTIYIQTDQNDGNVWFWWDGLTQDSDFGTNYGYYRSIFIEQSYTYGFNFQDSAYNCYGGFSYKIINSKTYRGQTWLGFSEQFLPLIWTTIPLSNFVINGERYDSNKSGGAGSGYIGNSLLSNKKMVGYNVPTSSAESTKTESVNEVSASAVSGKPKSGNGFARIKLISQAHQNVNVSANNQLKNDGVSPTVIDGQMGEYDSNTQSYYFTDACSFTYSNGKISKQVLQSAKRLLFEMEVRLDNESISNYIDASIHMKYGIEGYRLLGVISGNGTITTGDYSFFWMNNGTVQKNDTAPLDVSANRGAFHKVRFELLMNNSTVTTMNCYLDEELYKTKSINQALVLDYDEYNIYCDIPQYAYVRSYKVEVI